MNCIWILLLLLCTGNKCNGTNEIFEDCGCMRQNVRGDADCGCMRQDVRGDADSDRGWREERTNNRSDADDDYSPRRRRPADDEDGCPCTRDFDYYRAEAVPQSDERDEQRTKE